MLASEPPGSREPLGMLRAATRALAKRARASAGVCGARRFAEGAGMTRAEATALLAEALALIKGAPREDMRAAAVLYQGAIARALVVIADVLLEREPPAERLGH